VSSVRLIDREFPEVFAGDTGVQRIQSKRVRSMPAAAPEGGWKESPASMSVQVSPRRVAAARVASNTLVRPEEVGPLISVRQPRGRPPVS